MTEPQTIATALSAQLIINRVFRDQHKLRARVPKKQPPRKPDEKIKLMGIDDMDKHQVFFNLIFIIAPFEITGFVSLHKHIIEREPLPPGSLDTLKRIKPIALKNMELWNEIQAIEPDEKIFACYEIHPDNSISRKYKRSGDYEGQRFTNDDLFRYCDSVEDLISSCLPKDAPPAKDQEPTKKHPEKWYSLYHLILIAIGEQVPNFAESSKAEIINYGSEKYGTGQTFYTELRKIDLNNLRDYIVNMTTKDRKSWKNIITDISENNAEIITWLSKQPN